MKTLTGQGFGAGHAMGRAARLSLSSGRATLEETLLVELDRWRKREDVPLGLVLVAEDPATALLLPLPEGAALNGVVSERLPTRPPLLPHGVALIAGVDEALLAIGEGQLLLLEPERGRATVEPSAFDVARLQAKHQPRVLLDEQNFPAFTTEGVQIAVWGHAKNLAEAQHAMAAGADGLLLTDGPWDDEALWAAQELVGGGDLALALPFESVDPESVVRLAARSRLRWCLHPEELPLSLDALKAELRELVTELTEENQRAEVPLLVSLEGEQPGFDETLSLSGDFAAPDPERPPWEQVPLRVRVEWVFGQFIGLEEVLEREAAGVIVEAEGVAPLKEQIRHWG